MKPTTRLPRVLLFTVCSLWAGSALAQQDPNVPASPFAPETTQPAPVAQQPYAPPTPVAVPYVEPPPPQDGPRFRWGVAGGGGGEFGQGVSFWLVGFDFRLGVQVNDMIGIYVQPHLSAGNGDDNGAEGTTATFAVAGMVDITLSDLVFFGGGFGYGVLNNPSGPMLALRGGIYPALGRAIDRPRRKALSLSFEFRTHFIDRGPVVQVMGMVGFESF